MTRPPGPTRRAPGAERVPSEPRDQLARFFAFSHDVLALIEAGGRVRLASPSAERVTGHPGDTLAGRRALGLVHPQDRRDAHEGYTTVLAGRQADDVDVRIRRSDGGWVPMRWSLFPGPEGWVYAVGRDHTERVRHRDALLRNERDELRLRTARELHDGILQTLTGASLQIAVARRLVGTDPSAAEDVLETLNESIAAEQQQMRLYVDELSGRAPVWTDATRALPERIESVLDRVGAIWGVATSVDVRVDGRIRGEFGRQLVRIVQEATVNAARHGGADSVSVMLTREDAELALSVTDDGWGFPFRGEYDHATLNEKRLGPLSLKHRVEDAGGHLSIRSTEDGASVLVRLPLSPEDIQ